MSIGANSIYDDGVQIPCIKLYSKGVMNEDLIDLLCRNSREPDWYRSDLTAIVAATKTAGGRVCELIERFGVELYKASCDELLSRNRVAMKKIIDSTFTSEVGTFTDMVDDDGHGVGPWAITCSLHRTDEGKLRWDWSGKSSPSPQAPQVTNWSRNISSKRPQYQLLLQRSHVQ
jgi:5-oxoprolinase (ATP-hydrolysing)